MALLFGADSRTRHRRFLALLCAVAVGAVSWFFAPAGSPPLYDGIGFPDEPYRFVQPPAGYRHTAPPTTLHGNLTKSQLSDAQTLNSGESGPQISLYFPAHSFAPPAAAPAITVTATPVVPPQPAPPEHLWGDVYRVTLQVGGQPVRVTPSAQPQIQMRAPTPQQPGPTFVVLQGGGWRRMQTDRTGNDIYAASFLGAGYYALVGVKPVDFNAPDPNNEANVSSYGLIIGGVAVVGVIVAFVAVERRRGRRRRERRSAAG